MSWIDISEKKPEIGKTVLWNDGKYVFYGYIENAFSGDGLRLVNLAFPNGSRRLIRLDKLIAWMPLPDPILT